MATSVDRNHQYARAELSGLSQAEFVRVLGPVFEHSPWIAGWAARAVNSRTNEVKTALVEISKIAELRLKDSITH